MARFAWCSLALLIGCTPIAPLVHDAGGTVDPSDAGADAARDAGLDAASDAGPDARCNPADRCDGTDDDCDPATPDGSGEPAIGTSCDGADEDLCEEGAFVCSAGALRCDDETDGATELCDGIDNDCDPSTPDGSDESGGACDGEDEDLCTEGVLVCIAGALRCDDETDGSTERCDGADNDCDGRTDEDGALGSTAFYPDADMDSFGDADGVRMACARPSPGTWLLHAGDCDDSDPDVRPGRSEACNARDDDCDAMIDERSPCLGCETSSHMGGTYLFCETNETWVIARTACQSRGYELVVIDDAAENTFVQTEAERVGLSAVQGAWIGLSDRMGAFGWVDGSPLGYASWEPGEPDDIGDCVRVDPRSGGWFVQDCASTADYVCEAP